MIMCCVGQWRRFRFVLFCGYLRPQLGRHECLELTGTVGNSLFQDCYWVSLLIKVVYSCSFHMAWTSSQHGLRQGDFLHADSGLLTTCSREQDGSFVTSCDLASVTEPLLPHSIVQSHHPGLSRSDRASASQ